MLPEAFQQTVDVPLWLLLGLAGYHRAIRFGQGFYDRRRGRRDGGSS